MVIDNINRRLKWRVMNHKQMRKILNFKSIFRLNIKHSKCSGTGTFISLQSNVLKYETFIQIYRENIHERRKV